MAARYGDTRWPRHSAGFAIAAFFGLLVLSTGSAEGASLTCVRTATIDETTWGSNFLKELREIGFSPPGQPLCTTVMLAGDIEKGDANRLEALIQTNLPFLGMLALNSDGGSISEAMQIGRVARRYYLSTMAASLSDGHALWLLGGEMKDAQGAICASACFFAWLGGVKRIGDVLGIHRPFPPTTEMQKLSPLESEQLYRDVSERIRAYLAEMDAAPHWLSDMMGIPSDELQMISKKEVQELEGDARMFFDIPSLAQWKFSKCGALSSEEWEDLQRLALQAAIGTLPTKLQGYLHYLDRQMQAVVRCGLHAVLLARWQLRPVQSQQ